ncbi:MAG: FmdB family transcriptional regulator [Actinobacteria bacterium]|nr:MAG: FmdB family transcriptional regulator [Actinomycetota bacterium]
MPTYEYACKSCGQHLEVVQSFKDDSLTTCAVCGGPLRKVFGSIGISFKGSGFYRNDSRPAASSSSSEKASSDKASTDKASSDKSSDKSSSASSSSESKSSSDGSKSDSKSDSKSESKAASSSAS